MGGVATCMHMHVTCTMYMKDICKLRQPAFSMPAGAVSRRFFVGFGSFLVGFVWCTIVKSVYHSKIWKLYHSNHSEKPKCVP